MSRGTVVVPIAPTHRPYWQLHLSAFAMAEAAAKAVLTDGGPLAAARYAARRHLAHPVWAAWALARAQTDLGLPTPTPLPALALTADRALPLALPERPGMLLPALAWPDWPGTWWLDWDDEGMRLSGPRPATARDKAPERRGAGLKPVRAAPPGEPIGRCWLALVGLPLLLASGLVQEAAGEVGGKLTYEARRGETLRRIAERVWGEASAWPRLWQANRTLVPNPGFVATDVRVQIPETVPEAVPLPAGPYRVVPGDTLWDIAGRLYGDSWAWPLIWAANRGRIHDPHWIYPDQLLAYPTAGDLYVVRPGDSLWAIAERRYGSGQAWRRVWQANRGWLAWPDHLRPGDRLWLPLM